MSSVINCIYNLLKLNELKIKHFRKTIKNFNYIDYFEKSIYRIIIFYNY